LTSGIGAVAADEASDGLGDAVSSGSMFLNPSGHGRVPSRDRSQRTDTPDVKSTRCGRAEGARRGFRIRVAML
jgi:hypothetical protein